MRSTLRYAVQLLTPAKVMVQNNGREAITKVCSSPPDRKTPAPHPAILLCMCAQEDVEEIDSLFYDAKASAKLLIEQQGGYLQ